MVFRVSRLLHCGLCLVFVSLVSCVNVNDWGQDAPHIRELQKKSLVGIPNKPIDGQGIEDFFRDRVGLIATAKKRLPTGRAVPISADGYFLTAWHVVDEGEFFLSDFVQLKSLPVGVVVKAKDYYRVDKHPGRVVWHDKKVDLAIVKFDFQIEHQFRLASYQGRDGSRVFSAAVGTNSGTLLVSDGISDGVGNGPYQTAGSILKSRSVGREKKGFVYGSTLVARGGMSGGPVVDIAGNLVGVITQIRPSIGAAPTTSFSMIAPSDIAELIRKDRGLN